MRVVVGIGLCLIAASATAKDVYPPVQVLLSSSETVLGQQIEYPKGDAKITAAIVTMQPGQKTGAHLHNAPLFGYMLEGELTVDYGTNGSRRYVEGDSLLEAFKTLHNGENTGEGIARVLVVFAGAGDTPNTVVEE
jgi:quercetin dioxygenase-like cupin family protein